MADAGLPPGWTAVFSNSRKSWYYRNAATKETQWERPGIPQAPVLPPPAPAEAVTPVPASHTPVEHEPDLTTARMNHLLETLRHKIEETVTLKSDLAVARAEAKQHQAEAVSATNAAYTKGLQEGRAEQQEQMAAAREASAQQCERMVEQVRGIMQEQQAAMLSQVKSQADSTNRDLQRQLEEAQTKLAQARAEAAEAEQAASTAGFAAAAEHARSALADDLAAEQKEVAALRARLAEAESQHAAASASAASAAADELQRLRSQVDSLATQLSAAEARFRKHEAEAAAELQRAVELEASSWEAKSKSLVAHANAAQARARALAEQVIDLQGRMRVYVRVRPATARAGEQPGVTVLDCQHLHVQAPKLRVIDSEMDYVFDQACSQEQVWEETRHLIGSVRNGYNCAVMAYGQTGSGKTFTMQGSAEQLGIVPRALQLLVQPEEPAEPAGEPAPHAAASAKPTAPRCALRVVEIYNEQVRDLQQTKSEAAGLTIRQLPSGPDLPDAVITPISSVQQGLAAMQAAERRRAMAAHHKNEHSSRSHLVVTLFVLPAAAALAASDASSAPWMTDAARLHLVDLAGSERLSATGATGSVLKEAQHINKSLSALGDVMRALAAAQASAPGKASFVPFRNSKLTYLLQPTLTAGGRVLLLAALSPESSDAAESACTMQFADKCRSVRVGAADPGSAAREQRLRQEVAALKAQLRALQAHA